MPVEAGSHLDPEATKAKVLQAASELFYERGVHAVGVNDIAARASASKLSIYRYFQSKDGLVAAALARRSDRVHAWLAKQIADTVAGRERVLALFDRLVRWYGEESYRGCGVMNTAIDTRGGDTTIQGTVRDHLARYRSLLAGELEHAGLHEPEALARQLLVLIEGATVTAALEGTPQAGTDARHAAEVLLDSATRTGTAPPRGDESAS